MPKEVVYEVPDSLKKEALLSKEEYEELYEESLNNPKEFWSKQADSYLEWISPWETVYQSNFKNGEVSWFKGGKINATINCIDRHLKNRSDQTAIIWEGNDHTEEKSFFQ